MPHVSEHHSKQPGESDCSEESWIDFLIARHSIHIHNILGRSSELIQGKASRRLEVLAEVYLLNLNSRSIDVVFMAVELVHKLSSLERSPDVPVHKGAFSLELV